MGLRPKRRRLLFVTVGIGMLGLATGLFLFALKDHVDLFLVPSGVYEKNMEAGVRFRLGGLVERGSWKKSEDGLTHVFRVTDLNRIVQVEYRGLLPNLFREGQGVVTEGKLRNDGTFIASIVLAKHDETYLPPEVAEAIKAQGQWKGQ